MANLDLSGIITRVCYDLQSKFAALSHVHGNITNGGDITATAPTIASGDQLIINDQSASKITNGPTFDGSTTTTALTPKGTWETFLKTEEAVRSAGGVSEAVVWADATATTPEFQLQSKHTNGQELALRIQDNGWMTLYKLTTADDWSTSTTLFDIPFKTITPSISITDSTGTSSNITVKRFGNVVHLTLKVKNSTATTNNAMIYAGTIATTALRPAALIQNSFSHGGGVHMNGWITTAGGINVRHMGTSSLAANQNVDISFVYLIA